MAGIKDLSVLLKSIQPELDKNEYVFLSFSENQLKKLDLDSLLIFKEKE